ncbi:MAG TPA: lysine biosynthesis protein LysX [Nitrososphaeraceae archaeon]
MTDQVKTFPHLAILYDQIRWEEKALYEAAKRRDFDPINIDCKSLVLGLNESEIQYQHYKIIQRCVSYFKNIHSTAALEGLGALVFNPLSTNSICGNKLFTHMILRKAGVRTPKAYAAFSESSAINALDQLGYPAIIKPTVGSWGRLIAVLADKEAAKGVLEHREHMFPLYQVYYLEEFVERPPRDIRAIVVGEQVIAAIYRYSGNGEWKTNMALGGRAENCPITNELEDICLDASRVVNGKIVGVDLMESKNDGLVVHEVNNTTEFKNTVKVTDIDIPGKIVEFVHEAGKH